MSPLTAAPGQVIGGRYRLERQVGTPTPCQGDLWLASDQLAAAAPAALRHLGPEGDQDRAKALWGRLQAILHPQVPRFGAVIDDESQLWLAREWQAGRTYQQLLEARRERQLVFGCGEVLLLLRQLLPVLAVLHSQELLHGDLSPANLLRRDSDGLPVLLDFGLVRGTAVANGEAKLEPIGCTPGFAPPALIHGEPAEPSMDLYSLGVVALVLLSGDDPAELLDPVTMEWRWPVALEAEPALAVQLHRLVSDDPTRRFPSASRALAAFQSLEMPDSTGPVPRADRTVMLLPQPASESEATVVDSPPRGPVSTSNGGEPDPERPLDQQAKTPALEANLPNEKPGAELVPPIEPASNLRRRYEEREAAAEGGLWPVLIALVVSAVAGTSLGWWWLSRDQPRDVPAEPELVVKRPSSLPPMEVDQRQLLLSRLRALRVDRPWFLKLVNANLLAQYPERKGRLPSDAQEDAPLRRVWNQLAEEWLARVEQLPISTRSRLGTMDKSNWERRQKQLERQGISRSVLLQLVSSNAQNLLPGRLSGELPPEPFRQLWYAAAERTLDNVNIEPIHVPPETTQLVSAIVGASGARVFPVRLPAGYSLVIGANGTPLLQMSVFAADGSSLESRGPLRVVTLERQDSSPVQLLITNEGVAQAEIRLQLRADPPPPPPPPQPTEEPEALPADQGLDSSPSLEGQRPFLENSGNENRPGVPLPSPASSAAPQAGSEASGTQQQPPPMAPSPAEPQRLIQPLIRQ